MTNEDSTATIKRPNNDVATAKRRRRFRREPDYKPDGSRAGRIELRRRDRAMIAAIARHRFLNTDQICKLFACDCLREFRPNQTARPAPVITHRPQCSCSCGAEGTKGEHSTECIALFKDDKHIASRLRELYQAGYLERPVIQLQLRVKAGIISSGSVPMVYSATKEGIDALEEGELAALGRGKMSWLRAPGAGTRVFMEHTLRTSDVSIAVDIGLRSLPHLRRLTEGELTSGMNEKRRKSPRPFSVKGSYQKKKLTAVCDLAFGLSDTAKARRRHVLVEVDLGHMPVDRANLTQTSIMRKVIAYATAHDSKQFETDFGWNKVTVLILTTSEARRKSCIEAAQKFFGAASVARIFLFGTLAATNNLLQYEFIDGLGKPVRLID